MSKTDSITNFTTLLDHADIEIDGAHPILFHENIHYLAFLGSRDSIELFNVSSGLIDKRIGLPKPAAALCSKGNKVYVFYEYQNDYTLITFQDSTLMRYSLESKRLPEIFNPNFFIATSNTSNIHVIDSTHVLIPYKIEGGFKNMLDSFAYIFCNIQHADSSFKMVNYEHPEKYDYLYRAVTEFDFETNQFIYGFQKSNVIHVVNLDTKQPTSITLKNFTSIEFPKDKIRNITYIRQYLKKNDRLEKILHAQHGNLFIIMKLAESSASTYRIGYWHAKQRKLEYTEINYIIHPSLAFIKNEKLYVPNEFNSYTQFTYTASMQ